MICPACGFANEDGVLFCEKCKADLEMPAAAKAAVADQQAAPASAEEPIPLEPIGQVYQPDAEPPVAPTSPGFVELEPVASPGAGTVEQPPATPPPLPPKPKTADHTEQAAAPSEAPTAPSTPATSAAPKLVVVRGQRMDVTYPLYPGKNYLGRTDDKPVDIDLEDQEAADRIWTSRQHAVITVEDGKLTIEDLNSLNGTFVNRARVHPGQVKDLQENDVIQVGTVHMKVVLG